MSKRITSTRSGLRRAGLALGAGAVIAGGVAGSAAATTEPAGDGEQIVIGFSAPAADHGWMAAITENARAYPAVPWVAAAVVAVLLGGVVVIRRRRGRR